MTLSIMVEKLIVQTRPMTDRVKINTDGASKGNPRLAGVGGLMRDDGGKWLGGFVANIGACSAYRNWPGTVGC